MQVYPIYHMLSRRGAQAADRALADRFGHRDSDSDDMVERKPKIAEGIRFSCMLLSPLLKNVKI